MNKNEIFENWYGTLSDRERASLIDYIVTNKLSITNEGYYTGPTGAFLKDGYYTGPSGSGGSGNCAYCGKKI